MTTTVARIKKAGKHFEIIVDMDEALKFKKGGSSDVGAFMEGDVIYSDSKKGFRASDEDMKSAFGTTDSYVIASKIVKEGEVQTTQEHREGEKEAKFKQVVEFLRRNAIDPNTKNPHTPERIKSALEQAGVNIKN